MSKDLQIVEVKAFQRIGPIGDIGLRAFFQLYTKAKEIILKQQIQFLYIPIPSFYVALLGRWLHNSTNIEYGIDYIDPWVHEFPGSEKTFSRHWFTTHLAKVLEPIALKKAALITGVAEGYYQAVLHRNPRLKNTAVIGALPYGGDAKDHEMVEDLNLTPYLFEKKIGKFQFVYAGAMLPKAYEPLEYILQCIAANTDVFENIEFHFIGTGKVAGDPESYNIRPLAEKYGLWKSVIFEYPARIPYLDVLVHLNTADAAFILGSTEAHYTPSKVYQAILAKKPVMAVLHENSTAAIVVQQSNAGVVLSMNEHNVDHLQNSFMDSLKAFKQFAKDFKPEMVNKAFFEEYSAYAATQKLVKLLNEVK